MAWCEANRVEYLLGLAKNERLKAEIAKEMGEAKAQYQETGGAARRFKVSNAEELEPRATGGGQGRAPGKGREPAIRGDVSECNSVASAGLMKSSTVHAVTWRMGSRSN